MQVQQLPAYQFLEGTGKIFVIPVYQRDYAWTRINCQKLWDDLVSLNNNSREDHFLGTIVTIGSGLEEHTIIDGQQRLITLSILLIALQTYLKNKKDKNDAESILEEQLLDFLINKYAQDQKNRIRLKPNKQDKEYFEKLFEYKDTSDINSNIVNNYQFFYDKISSGILTPQQIFNGFRKLKIVSIDLIRGQDNPQLIFESLNSTGVDLTAGDLIRNYILMDLDPIQQEKMYREHWIEIEKLTGDVAEFVRNYLIFRQRVWVKKDDVYESFKKLSISNFNEDKEGILNELKSFAEIYSWLVQIKDYKNNNVNKGLERIHKLEFTVCYPYLLDVFSDLNEGILSEKTVSDILTTIESYAFRKILVDNTTQGLNKLFIVLGRDIKKEESWKEQYKDILNYLLLEKIASQRFPTDEEFENALINREIYHYQSKNINYLLESLENFKSAYPIDMESLTIEHIMPQTLTKDWKNKLGENWQEIYKKYLHTLGNLSLTAKNSEMSNNSFEDKQKIDFQISKLKLNFKIDGLKEWNEKTILKRAKELIKNAMVIWPYPKTTYTKPTPEEQIFDLASEDSFSNTKPLHLYMEVDDNGIELKTWREILINVCNKLYEYSPTQFKEMQINPEFQWYFNLNKPMRSKLEFRPNEFVEAAMSANSIISFLANVCESINYPPENIKFSIKNTEDLEI